MENRKSWQIPTFGNWDYEGEMPITQYFESARQAGLVRDGFSVAGCEEDLFVPVAMPVKLAYQDGLSRRKVRKGNDSGEQEKAQKKQMKQGRISDHVVGKQRKPIVAPKAVDEDLYKIPPELLCQQPKKKRLLRNLFSECMGLNCITCA